LFFLQFGLFLAFQVSTPMSTDLLLGIASVVRGAPALRPLQVLCLQAKVPTAQQLLGTRLGLAALLVACPLLLLTVHDATKTWGSMRRAGQSRKQEKEKERDRCAWPAAALPVNAPRASLRCQHQAREATTTAAAGRCRVP
jgi:hypothetical protein